MIDPFRHSEYATSQRPPILRGYVEMQIDHLRRKHPDTPLEVIEGFVRKVVSERMVVPTVDVVIHPTPGNSERKSIPLTTFTNKHLAQNIASPSGTCYTLPDKRESFLKISLATKLKERKKYKGIMLKAMESGDSVRANTYNLLQASTKIFVNSAPGAMNSEFNILYDKPGFNAITSISRHSVKSGYAHTERLVGGNVYLPSMEDVKAYCLRLAKVMPQQTAEVIAKFGLHIPTIPEVAYYLHESLRKYVLYPEMREIIEYLRYFSDAERTFIFYAGCLKNLFFVNGVLFKGFLTEFFRDDIRISDDITVKDIKSVEGTMLAMITSINYEMYGKNEKGNYRNLEEAEAENPESVRKTVAIARHMEGMFDLYGDIFGTFIRVDHDFARTGDYNKLVRKVVVVSDTDSVIFTTQEFVSWRCKDITYKKEDYEANAFVVYVTSRTLEHVFARLSCGFGMIGEDIYRIAMKNEFLYPALMRSPNRKHYVGVIEIQEGKRLPKLKNDIKGLGYRSSTLPKSTTSAAEAFNIGMLKDFVQKQSISAVEKLHTIADFEASLYNSLMSGERDFLQTQTIKTSENYPDPSITAYFYYELWEAVFAGKFDHMAIPSKHYKLPLIGGGKILSSPEFLNELEAFDKGCHGRLLDFMADHPKKALSMLIVPNTLTTIPEIFRKLIDVRGIIYTNVAPFMLGISSIGMAYNYKSNKYLISDYFNPHDLTIPF